MPFIEQFHYFILGFAGMAILAIIVGAMIRYISPWLLPGRGLHHSARFGIFPHSATPLPECWTNPPAPKGRHHREVPE